MRTKNVGDLESALYPVYSKMAESNDVIDSDTYQKFDVKRGLRDISGKGVLVGLTRLGEVIGSVEDEGSLKSIPGELYYRGIEIRELVRGQRNDGRQGFHETVYLLLFGCLPDAGQLKDFESLMSFYRETPETFIRDVILKLPGKDVMNGLARYILAMYNFDDEPDDVSIPHVLKQSLKLIARLAPFAVYGYQTYAHYYLKKSLVIHAPKAELSTAENILHMLRHDSVYTKAEADLLDLSLVLHAEHGGGNNSSFLTHVITSSGTDTYSAIAAAIGSLKGPRHGGANIKVVRMMDDLKASIVDWEDEDEIGAYLFRLLEKKAFDRSGLIYGMGHAVYSLSDPRSGIFKQAISELAETKELEAEYRLYSKVERLAPQVIAEHRKIYKGVCANIDFYSGFAYRMLGIPEELFTPLFAVSRIVGWCSHRLEELINAGKIIRPAYKSVSDRQDYLPLDKRNGVGTC
jgi:citrate synthase